MAGLETVTTSARQACALLAGSDDAETMDLEKIEAGLTEAQTAAWSLTSLLAEATEPTLVDLDTLKALQRLGAAVLGAYPTLHRLELDMLRHRLSDDGLVNGKSMAKVSFLRGRSLAASRALHRGLIAAYATHEEAAS